MGGSFRRKKSLLKTRAKWVRKIFAGPDAETGMPRKPKKPVAAQNDANKSYDEFVDEGETVEDDTVPGNEPGGAVSLKSRDWRDVEKLQEERRLRKAIADELDFDIDDRPRRR
jgi:hypothetical protein